MSNLDVVRFEIFGCPVTVYRKRKLANKLIARKTHPSSINRSSDSLAVIGLTQTLGTFVGNAFVRRGTLIGKTTTTSLLNKHIRNFLVADGMKAIEEIVNKYQLSKLPDNATNEDQERFYNNVSVAAVEIANKFKEYLKNMYVDERITEILDIENREAWENRKKIFLNENPPSRTKDKAGITYEQYVLSWYSVVAFMLILFWAYKEGKLKAKTITDLGKVATTVEDVARTLAVSFGYRPVSTKVIPVKGKSENLVTISAPVGGVVKVSSDEAVKRILEERESKKDELPFLL